MNPETLISEKILQILGGDLVFLQQLDRKQAICLIEKAIDQSALSAKIKFLHKSSSYPRAVLTRAKHAETAGEVHFFIVNMIMANRGYPVINIHKGKHK